MADVSGKWITLMVDEMDMSNTEQMVVCLRSVDNCLKVYEVLGLYSLESTSAETTVSTINKDVLLCINLTIDVPWPMLYWGQDQTGVFFFFIEELTH